MTPLIRDAPNGLRCEADLHAARIQLRAPLSKGRLLFSALLLGGVVLIASSVAGVSNMLPVANLTLLVCVVWNWAFHRRLSILLDPHILDIKRSRFGAHYRIPLVDITAVRLLDIRKSQSRLSLELEDDRIEIGQGFAPSELAWLASVVRASVKAASERPEQRTGHPDEVPAQLAALKSTQRP